MTEFLAKGIASLGVVGAGMLAVGIPDDPDSWTMLMEKFGVLAFVIVCSVLGLAFLVPRLLDMFQKYLERQDARYDKAQEAFLSTISKMSESLDRLTAKIDRLEK